MKTVFSICALTSLHNSTVTFVYGDTKLYSDSLVSRDIREHTILGRERRPRLDKTKTAITEIKAVQLCRKHNLKDLSPE